MKIPHLSVHPCGRRWVPPNRTPGQGFHGPKFIDPALRELRCTPRVWKDPATGQVDHGRPR